MTFRNGLLLVSIASCVLTQAHVSLAQQQPPIVLTFVAPAYPRAAKDQRIQGTTRTRITVSRDGYVTQAETISAHPVFERYVLEALKQWRFQPSDQVHKLQITCVFEFEADCEGTDKHPITSETRVSADLPTRVRIRTGLQCKEVTTALR